MCVRESVFARRRGLGQEDVVGNKGIEREFDGLVIGIDSDDYGGGKR